MGKYCASKSTPEFKALQKETNIKENLLITEVSLFQELNGKDKYPTIKDLPIEMVVKAIKGVSYKEGGYFLTKRGEISARNSIFRLSQKIGYNPVNYKKANHFGEDGRIITYLTFNYPEKQEPIEETPIDIIEENPTIETTPAEKPVQNYNKDLFGNDIMQQLVPTAQPIDPKIESEMKRLISELGIDLVNYEEYAKFYKEKYGKELTAVAVADMFNKVIAVNEGYASKDTLPEEVGHFIEFALRDDKRIQYAIDNVHLTDLWKQKSEQYLEEYNNDENKVRREIVGQLIGASLIDNIENETRSWKRLLLQIWSKFLDFFTFGNKVKERRMRTTIDSIAKETLNDTTSVKKGLEQQVATKDNVLFQLDPELFKNSRILEGERKSVEAAYKVLKNKIGVANKKEALGFLNKEQKALIKIQDTLKKIDGKDVDEYTENHVTLSLINFINLVENNAIEVIDQMYHIEEDLKKGAYENQLNQFSKLLKETHDYLKVYEPITKDLEVTLIKMKDVAKRNKLPVKEHKKILKAFKNINRGMDIMKKDYLKHSKFIMLETFRDVLMRDYYYNGDAAKVQEKLNEIEILLEATYKDITKARTFGDSMAESHDDILGLLDRVYKEADETQKLRTEEMTRNIVDLHYNLKQSGVENTSFMAEILEGQITGNFVQIYNKAKFDAEELHFVSKLNAQYGLPNGTSFEDKKAWDEAYYKLSDRNKSDYWASYDIWEIENTEPNEKLGELLNKKYNKIFKNIMPFLHERQQIYDILDKYPDHKTNPESEKRMMKELEDTNVVLYRKFLNVRVVFNDWRRQRQTSDFVGNTYYRKELAVPKMSKYSSKQYEEIMANPAKKAYYEGVMKIRDELLKGLPENIANSILMPMVRKDFVERVKDNPSEVLQEAYRDTFKRRENDYEFGDKLLNEDGSEIKFIPILHTRKLDNMQDLSLDVTASMILFIDTVNKYKGISKVVDIMEVAGDVLKIRKVHKASSKVGSLIDKVTGSYKDAETELVTTGGNAYYRYEKFMRMNVYGELKEDQGSTFGFDNAKIADALIKYTAMNNLALNLYASVNNVVLGNIMVRQEAFANEYVDHKNLLFADKTYWSELPKLMADIGEIRTNNKLTLMLEHLDALQDHENRVRDTNSERSVWGRMFTTSTLFFLTKGGEHQIQSKMTLALMDAYKVKDSKGNEINLYDAFEVSNYRIKLMDGVTKLDGKPFTEQDLVAFRLRLKGLNQSLHGVYTTVDKAVMQRWWLGRAVALHRKWIKPGWNRRFEDKYHNYSIGSPREGMYMTSIRFFNKLREELKDAKFTFAAVGENFDKLEDWEKANIRRNITEVGYFVALTIGGILLSSLVGDDDDDWYLNMLAYQVNRLGTEIGFFVPIANIDPMKKLIQSPSATVNQLDKVLDFVNIVAPYDALTSDDPFFRVYQSGRHKGNTRLKVWTKRTVPLWASVDDWFHPDEKLKFFTN